MHLVSSYTYGTHKCFVFLQTKFVDASFILLQHKPNSYSYNCIERNLNILNTCPEDTVFWDVSPLSLLGICPFRQNLISPSFTLKMETERTYETYLPFSQLYGITGDIEGNLSCVRTSAVWDTRRKAVRKNLRAESTEKNMNVMAVA